MQSAPALPKVHLRTPQRLAPKRAPFADVTFADSDLATWMAAPRASLTRSLRPFGVLCLILPWTAVAALIQAVLLLLPGWPKVAWPRVYWAVMCRLIGLHVNVVGTPAQRGVDGRPLVYVSNHSSWLDILVLGSRLNASFTAKGEVGTWPVIRTIARLGRTVYVRRQRATMQREAAEMSARLRAGDNLILFPEGTTSDGSRVLPFRSAFLSIAEVPVTADHRTALVQPVSVVYDRLAGLPTGRASRPVFAWYGDMDIASHFWRLAGYRGLRVTVLLHTPLDPAAFPNRKALSAAVWKTVADGAATLRQNRAARPITADAPAHDDAGAPAFA
jgi:1-acyl-sn-glycerol-3-phosphate acyltransferase